MRLLFVNYAHPGVAHVSGMRLRYFAEALARRGHKIVLLTRTKDDEGTTLSLQTVQTELKNHDWSLPYHLASRPLLSWSLEKLRDPECPRITRKLLITWNYVFGEGLFSDWSAGSRQYWPLLAREFRPQATWGTFGNIDSWVIARGIANAASSNWVMDAKDGWSTFIPRGLSHLLARRFQDAAAMTANSLFFGQQFEKWFPHKSVVIYSGAADYWSKFSKPPKDIFRITLMGSLYTDDNLIGFFSGLAQWLKNLPEAGSRRIVFTYAGGGKTQVEAACKAIEGLCEIDLHGYLSQEELALLCRTSAVNAYLWSRGTFHHKVVELLCARRPIIVFRGEHEEARALAADMGGRLYACADEFAVGAALTEIWNSNGDLIGDENKLKTLTWDSQAELLENVFKQVVGEEPVQA